MSNTLEIEKNEHFSKYKHLYIFFILVCILPGLLGLIIGLFTGSSIYISDIISMISSTMGGILLFIPALLLGFSKFKYKWIIIAFTLPVFIYGYIDMQTCTGKFCGLTGLMLMGFSICSFLMFLEGAYYNTWGKYVGYGFLIMAGIYVYYINSGYNYNTSSEFLIRIVSPLYFPVILIGWLYITKQKIETFSQYKHFYIFLLLMNILVVSTITPIFDMIINIGGNIDYQWEIDMYFLKWMIISSISISSMLLLAFHIGNSQTKYKWQIFPIFMVIPIVILGGNTYIRFGLDMLGYHTYDFIMYVIPYFVIFLAGAYYNKWGKYLGYILVILLIIYHAITTYALSSNF